MKVLDMFFIVCIIAVSMFGLIYVSSVSTPPSSNVDSFGHTVANNQTNLTYGMIQNTTAFEVQGAGAGIVIVAASVIMIIIFAFIVLSRGKYSKNKYRT